MKLDITCLIGAIFSRISIAPNSTSANVNSSARITISILFFSVTVGKDAYKKVCVMWTGETVGNRLQGDPRSY